MLCGQVVEPLQEDYPSRHKLDGKHKPKLRLCSGQLSTGRKCAKSHPNALIANESVTALRNWLFLKIPCDPLRNRVWGMVIWTMTATTKTPRLERKTSEVKARHETMVTPTTRPAAASWKNGLSSVKPSDDRSLLSMHLHINQTPKRAPTPQILTCSWATCFADAISIASQKTQITGLKSRSGCPILLPTSDILVRLAPPQALP